MTGAARAAKRVRDRLWCRLQIIADRRDLAEVRITPARYGGGTVWCVMAVGCNRREIPLPGRTSDIVRVLREAFPDARWDRAQNYDITTGILAEHTTAIPACLSGDAL